MLEVTVPGRVHALQGVLETPLELTQKQTGDDLSSPVFLGFTESSHYLNLLLSWTLRSHIPREGPDNTPDAG
jgi:hypothetical protein